MQVGWSLLRNLGWRLLLVLCPLSKSVPPNTVLRDGDRYYLKIWWGWGECYLIKISSRITVANTCPRFFIPVLSDKYSVSSEGR